MRKKIEFKKSENKPTSTLLRHHEDQILTDPVLAEVVDEKQTKEILSAHENDSENDPIATDPKFPDFPKNGKHN